MFDIEITKTGFEKFLYEKLKELDAYEETLYFEDSEWAAIQMFNSLVDGFDKLPKNIKAYAQSHLMIGDGFAFRQFINGIYFSRKGKVLI